MAKKKNLDLSAALDEFHQGVREYVEAVDKAPIHVVGIRTGGVWLAKEIATTMNFAEPLGELCLGFRRCGFGGSKELDIVEALLH